MLISAHYEVLTSITHFEPFTSITHFDDIGII